MIATSHVIIGGTAGVIAAQASQNPALSLAAAFVAGVASHIICDLIPHIDHPNVPKINGEIIWVKKVYIFAFTDTFFAFFLTLFLWIVYFDFPYITAYPMGALGGYLPDFIDNVPFWKEKIRSIAFFRRFHSFHQFLHDTWNKKIPMPDHWILGTVTQTLIVGCCLWYFL